ncbi:hypothetical protein LTR85_003337 [Meristemomyces frigidus]|nr:hypothetical protein LTR85_003337 [Meristemomyces frigidus]
MAQSVAELAGIPFAHAPSSLKNLLIWSAQTHSDGVAVVALHQAANLLPALNGALRFSTYLRWTYSDLFHGAKLLAAALHHRGVRKGDHIVALLPNSAEWALGFWAAVLLGCPWFVVQPRAATSSEEVKHILELSRAKVILAWDTELITQLGESAPRELGAIPVKIICSDSGLVPEQWLLLRSLLAETSEPLEVQPDDPLSVADDLTVVLFTSGTTGRPKGCPHTNRTLASMFQNHAYNLGLDEHTASVSHLPLAHCFGLVYSVSFWVAGAKVVYPDKTFDARSTLEAIRLEKCTHMPAVPSILYGLLDAATLGTKESSTVRHIELSGTTITPEAVQLAQVNLGAYRVSSHYGATESGPAVAWHHTQVPETYEGSVVSPGLPVPGGRLRICAPGTRTVVKRGEAGEIHQSGPQVIAGYLGGDKHDQFYDDHLGHWMVTGDQGIMMPSGELHVNGRYKDIIIRGGENIAPAQIEAVLNCQDGVERLGTTFALDQVILLTELGLHDFPKTASGKVKKMELSAEVREFRTSQTIITPSPASPVDSGHEEALDAVDPIYKRVVDVWTRILGVDEDYLTADTSVAMLADSLTMMQARRLFRKEHGLEISLPELLENPTIASQAAILGQAKQPEKTKTKASSVPLRRGPPTAFDMVEAYGDDVKAGSIQQHAAPVLSKYGLNWERDVEDVLPMGDVLANMVVLRRRLRSSLRRDAFWSAGTSFERMTSTLERALTEHPVLRSMWFPSSASSVSQLIIRPTEECWSTFIHSSGHAVDTPEDLAKVWCGDNKRDLCDAQMGPGALFRVVVFHIRSEPNAAGFIYWANHAAFDATSLSYFQETIEDLICGRSVSPRTSYKLWADAWFAGRNGSYAQAGARHSGNIAKGFADHRRSTVPQPRAPGFLEGNDAGWIDPHTGKVGDQAMRVPLDGEDGRLAASDGLARVYHLPGLEQLRTKHNIAAHTVLKASLALANTDWTGTQTAYFRSLQCGRQWPFMDPALASHLPSAVDVDGPTLQASFNLIKFDKDRETVRDLLERMKADQDLATRYEFTPMGMAMAQLSELDRSAVMERGLSQLFNWVPNNRHLELKRLQQIQSEMNADTGLHWDFTYLDVKRVEVYVRWDACQLKKTEIECMLDDMEKVARWLSEPEHFDFVLSGRPRESTYRAWCSPSDLDLAARSMVLSG